MKLKLKEVVPRDMMNQPSQRDSGLTCTFLVWRGLSGGLAFWELSGLLLKDGRLSLSTTCWLQIWSGWNWQVPRDCELPQMIMFQVETTG